MSIEKQSWVILALYFLLGVTYLLVNPVFEGGDEFWHYPMVRHLADGNPLPVQVFDPELAGPWKQQASQPPLYYYLAAGLSYWIDTSDMEQLRWLNPHVDNGIITEDGNTNLTIHNPNWSPWRGTLLAVRIIRFFSLLLGCVTVYCSYRIGRILFEDRPEIALGGMSIVAFLPMFLFVSSAVNNDNLIIALSSLAVLSMIRLGRDPSPPRWHDALILGIVIGLACLTKIIGVGLLPLGVGTLFIAHWNQPRTFAAWQKIITHWLAHTLVMVAAAVSIAGWWYLRNVQLYGDWKGWNAFIAVLGQRNQPASLAQLWDERFGFMMSFWGLFGGVNIPMWQWSYALLNGILILSVIGFAIYAVRLVIDGWRSTAGMLWWNRPIFLVKQQFALVVCLLWTAAIVIGLIQWATTTWSSQGRLVFAALSAEMGLLLMGLTANLPRRWAISISSGLGIGMFALAAITPWLFIGPAYRPILSTESPIGIEIGTPVTYGGQLRLNHARIGRTQLTAGESVDLYLDWEVIAPIDRNWTVFVHLDDPLIDTPIAQRDMYLGQGLLGSSFLTVGQKVTNHYHLQLPPTTYAPAQLALNVGLYDEQGRLPTDSGADFVTLAELPLVPRSAEHPNATDINFDDQLHLIGYQLSQRRVKAGEKIDLQLDWEVWEKLSADYSLTAQLLPQEVTDTTRWASADLALLNTTWQPSTRYPIPLSLAVNPDTPAGVYRLVVGVYTRHEDGSFYNLPLVENGRITNDNLLNLTKIRIER